MKKNIELLKERKLKTKEIKILKREPKSPPEVEYRELNLFFGSVWSIPDKAVPFDYMRKLEDIKDANRPCLILETPESFFDNSYVELAPGTTKVHPTTDKEYKCLVAKVPPEDLRQTTYFLLYFRWTDVQKKLDKKLCELSTSLKNKLSNILKED